MTDVERGQPSEPQNGPDDGLETAIREVLRNPQSRRVFLWVMSLCGVYRSSFSDGPGTDFMEGQRNVGLKIIHELDAIDPVLYPQLLLDAAREKVASTYDPGAAGDK